MPIQVEIEEHPHYLAAKYTGTGRTKDIQAHYPLILARCRAAQLNKYLSNFAEVQFASLSTLDRYNLGRGAQVFGQAGIKVAVLAAPNQMDAKKFGEMVAQNAGTQARVFTEEASALAWLLADRG